MLGIVLGVAAVLAGWVAPVAVPAPAVPAAPVSLVVSCAEDVAACDSDGDGIGDLVEEAMCGSATCATGAEDADADGVADAEQLTSSLEQGGSGGLVQFPEFGVLRLVLPGPSVIDVLWVPVAGVLLLGAAAGAFFVFRARMRG